MSQCQYYQITLQYNESSEVRADRHQVIKTVDIPWCSHKHSPMQEEDVASVGASRILRCRGCSTNCQISPALQADVV